MLTEALFDTSLDKLTILGTVRRLEDFRDWMSIEPAVTSPQPQTRLFGYTHSGVLTPDVATAHYAIDNRTGRIRFQFNPNHCKEHKGLEEIWKKFISFIEVDSREVSEFHVAFDLAEDILNKYQVADSLPNRKPQRIGNPVETLYLGKGGSSEICIYNKKLERASKQGVDKHEDKPHWYRIECRPSRTEKVQQMFGDWEEYNPLSQVHLFRDMPTYEELLAEGAIKNYPAYCQLEAVIRNPDNIRHVGKNSRTVVRNLAIRYSSPEGYELGELWEKAKSPILREIEDWLGYSLQQTAAIV